MLADSRFSFIFFFGYDFSRKWSVASSLRSWLFFILFVTFGAAFYASANAYFWLRKSLRVLRSPKGHILGFHSVPSNRGFF